MENTKRKPVVAIDGPAGAGKSTTSKGVARELGYTYIDTGAMFRGIALLVQESGIDPARQEDVERLACKAINSESFRVERGAGVTRVLINGVDPGDRIRTPEIGRLVPVISAYAGVREQMLHIQQELGREGGIVMEGRDIGTTVFPDAEVKIYLTASDEERARRRADEWAKGGREISYETALEDVRFRDKQDRERPIAPLRQAEGAIVVDTTNMNSRSAIARVVELVRAAEQMTGAT